MGEHPTGREEGQTGAHRYRAFISYSHAADGQLAPALQAGIQRFAKPWYRLRALRVFRDRTGLGITPELWGSIEDALRNSAFFILLASPASADSKWVEKEVDWWLRNRCAGQLLVVRTDGEIVWDDAKADFDWTRTTAVPRRLEGAFKQEPHHLDLRWARTDTDLSLRRPKFAEAVASLAATLHGRSLDELIGEDIREHRKTLRLVNVAMVTLAVIAVSAVAAAVLAIQARNIAGGLASREQTKATLAANESMSRRLAAVSRDVQVSDEALSILLACEAVRLHPTAEAESALRQLLSGDLQPSLEVRGHRDRECYAAYSPDGTKVLTWGDDTAQICDAFTGKVLRELRGHTNDIRHGTFSVDGRRVCTVGRDDVARLWDAATGRVVKELRHEGITAALISPNGSRVLTLAWAKEAVLWDVEAGTRLGEIELYPIEFHDTEIASFDPQGNRVAVCSQNHPMLIEARTGKTLLTLEGHTMIECSIAFSPDGNVAVTASLDGTARCWRVATGQCERILKHDAKLYNARFSPDGKWVATTDSRHAIILWNAETGERAAQLDIRYEPEDPQLFRFSPDGKCLLTASFDYSTAELWETATGRRLAGLMGNEGAIRTLSFSPDGRRAVVGNIFAPARIYACDVCGSLEDLVASAKARVPRELTAEERQKYLTPGPRE